jgi:hypothetical protein
VHDKICSADRKERCWNHNPVADVVGLEVLKCMSGMEVTLASVEANAKRQMRVARLA